MSVWQCAHACLCQAAGGQRRPFACAQQFARPRLGASERFATRARRPSVLEKRGALACLPAASRGGHLPEMTLSCH